jgi:hypothetical protein
MRIVSAAVARLLQASNLADALSTRETVGLGRRVPAKGT